MARRLLKLALLCVLAIPSLSFSDQVAVSTFKGINTNESSVIIGPEFSQDQLNTEVTPGGKSVKKRAGYGLYKTLYATPPAPVHGGYHFFDSSGNDVQVWGSSTSLYGIVADGTPTQLVSSATVNSTWDCSDTQGSAYCVTSNRDAYIKTTGAAIVWNTSPLGTMVEATPDRMAVAGVTTAPSSIYLSASNAFTTYTVGPLNTDPFIESIASPGSKLTHLKWGCGKLLWWKDQSFGWFSFEDQYTAQVKIISDTIGTFDNTSAIDPGGNVWFRGQDGHIWEYDCSGLIKQSIEITPFVQSSGRRTADLWTQTSQSDWNSGAVIPVLQLSTAIASGDVVPGSFTVTENSSASGWGSGSAINFAVGTSSISLKINNSGSVTNNGMETGTVGNTPSNWTPGGSFLKESSDITVGCIAGFTGITGTYFAEPATGQLRASNARLVAQVLDANTSSVLDSLTVLMPSTNCTFTTQTLSVSSSSIGKRVKINFLSTDDSGASSDVSMQTSESYILGGNLSFDLAVSYNGVNASFACLDNVLNGSSTITTGSFTSQLFDTALTSATYQLTNFAWTVNDSTPTFALVTSTANPTNNWVTTLTSSGTNAIGNRYARYVSTISITASNNTALTSITAATILARSSGTLYSQWKNAPSFSQWSTFNPFKSDGDGSHTFYVRSSTSPQTVLNSTVTWVAQTADALVATSTPGIYFQIRDDFTIGAATNTPTLNSFTVNWFEGNATDQAYMHYFDNAIWASVAYGVGISTNNYIFRRDLINDGWVIYGFGAGGFLTQNAHLFFGGVPATAQVFEFGSGESDNGSTINAYWKSKDFTGNDPFIQNQYTNIDSIFKQNSNQSVTVTYDLDTSTTTTSYSLYLSSTTQSIINHRKQLPAGKNGYLFNIQYGDATTTSAWELLGYRVGFTPQTYRPSQ